jgi:hypothetical protein
LSGTTEQIMMTLAQFGVISSTERPSGESVEQQEQRILNGINGQLANTALPTGGEWQAVWIGLTQDRANLAYIAQNTSQNAFAVSLRGTQFNSLIDLSEDLNVGAVAEFTVATGATEPLLVSLGSMKAFTEVISATYVPNRTTLLQALIMLIENAPESPTLYITGHSLGGPMATMVALYLSAQTWRTSPHLPCTPAGLMEQSCITMTCGTFGEPGNFAIWRLRRGAELKEIRVDARVSVPDPTINHQLALAGTGVALLAQSVVRGDVEEGRLVRILPDWEPEPVELHALYPSRLDSSPKVRAFLQFLRERFDTESLPGGHEKMRG